MKRKVQLKNSGKARNNSEKYHWSGAKINITSKYFDENHLDTRFGATFMVSPRQHTTIMARELLAVQPIVLS